MFLNLKKERKKQNVCQAFIQPSPSSVTPALLYPRPHIEQQCGSSYKQYKQVSPEKYIIFCINYRPEEQYPEVI